MNQDINEVLKFEDILHQVDTINTDGDPKQLLQSLNDELSKMVKRTTATRKQSKISLTLNINPGPANTIQISAITTATPPKVEPNPMVSYVDSRGQLYGEDPSQTKLPLTRIERTDNVG